MDSDQTDHGSIKKNRLEDIIKKKKKGAKLIIAVNPCLDPPLVQHDKFSVKLDIDQTDYGSMVHFAV